MHVLMLNPSYYMPTINGKTFSSCENSMAGEVVSRPSLLGSILLLQQWQ